MSLGKITTLFKEHPFISCFLTIFLIYLFGEYYPNYFEQLGLKNLAYYLAMIFVFLRLSNYGYKVTNEPKRKHKQEGNNDEQND